MKYLYHNCEKLAKEDKGMMERNNNPRYVLPLPEKLRRILMAGNDPFESSLDENSINNSTSFKTRNFIIVNVTRRVNNATVSFCNSLEKF